MHLGDRIPAGFAAVNLAPGAPGMVRLAVLLDTEGGTPTPVQVRAVFGARVLLGAVMDTSDRIVEWVEIWIQQPESSGGSIDELAGAVKTNNELDQIWRRMIDGLEAAPIRDVIRTGFETTPPPPMWIDPSKMDIYTPSIEGAPAELCTDDQILDEVGLPKYSLSSSRYLWSPALGFESPFIAVGSSEIGGPAVPIEEAVTPPEDLIALNPHAGLLAVRRFAPMTLEQFDDVIGGADWDGPRASSSRLPFQIEGESSLTDEAERGIFLGRHGRWGRNVEALHIKLMAIADAMRLTSSMTRAAGRPMLGLTASSFRVQTPPGASGLPALWASRLTLAEPPMSIELRAGASSSCYLPADESGSAVYRPKVSTARVKGVGRVRIREVADVEGGVTVEATLATDEPLSPASNDIARLRLPIGDTPVEVFGRISADKAMAQGEWRVRGYDQPADAALAAMLKDAEGTTIEDTPFEVIPMLTTPCDLYSIAVIGAKLLLEGSGSSLAVAVDELHSLASEAAELFDDQTSLEHRIQAIFDRDSRWMETLGPLRLTNEPLDPEQAFAVIPSGLWFRTLALLVSMLPGTGPDSIAKDFGDARRGGLHLVFEPAIERAERLLEQTRSLIVIDWNYNREISGVIRGLAAGLTGAGVG